MDLKVGAYSEGGTVKAIGVDPNIVGGTNSGGEDSNYGGHWVGHCVVYSRGEDSNCGGHCIVCSGGEVSNCGGYHFGCESVVDSVGDV